MGSPLAFPPIQSSRPRFHAKKRFGPVQGSEEEEEGGEGVLCICQRASEQGGQTHRVGGWYAGLVGDFRGERRDETAEESWLVSTDTLCAQIGLGVAQKVIVRETRKGVDSRRGGGRKKGRELVLRVFAAAFFSPLARPVARSLARMQGRH